MGSNNAVETLCHSGTILLSDLEAICNTLKEFVPDPASWAHPERAREAVAAQQDWSERSLNRNTLDYLDKCRDGLVNMIDPSIQVTATVHQRHGGSEQKTIPLRQVVVDTFRDARKSILRHQNSYFRQMRYFFEIQVTGGKIPPFPGSSEEDERIDN